jgi:methylamine--corrinoid protein Co-methyltransferase
MQGLTMDQITRFLDIIDRSTSGPIIEEEQFNMTHVAKNIQRVIKKYNIKVDAAQMINLDDDLADRVWGAALDFLDTCGVYCMDTNRVISFTRQEMEKILQDAPFQVLLGEGDDSCFEKSRKVEDPNPPLITGGPIGMALPENLFTPIMESYVKEPLVDTICPGSLATVHGREIRTRSPLEVLAGWEEADLLLDVLRKTGRPGMASVIVVISISDVAQLSAISRGAFRATDLHTLGMISELKVNYQMLNKIAHTIRHGGIIDPYVNPIYGGLAGGIEGTAVLVTASLISLSLVFIASCHGSSPTHPFLFNNTSREVMQATSLAFQAIARNSHLMTNLTISPVGGPGTKTLLYECIAYTLMSTISGVSRLLGPRSATGSNTGHCSGLETRFSAEIAHAATKLSREEADEIVQKAYAQYAENLDKRPYGLPFSDVYDVESVTPNKEWSDLVDEVKDEAIEWGIPLV